VYVGGLVNFSGSAAIHGTSHPWNNAVASLSNPAVNLKEEEEEEEAVRAQATHPDKR